MVGTPCRVQGFMIFPGVPTTFPDYSTPFPTTPSMLAELNQGVAQAYSGHNGTNIMDKTVSFLVRTNNYARRTICGWGGEGGSYSGEILSFNPPVIKFTRDSYTILLGHQYKVYVEK